MKQLLIIALVASAPQAFAYNKADYEAQEAVTKQKVIYDQCLATEYNDDELPSKTPNLLGLLSARKLKPSFTHISDEMPEGRKKLIHPYGSVAKAKFVVTNKESGYTGVFESGAPAIIRLSLGVPGRFTPGMGVKLLIDGMPSVNLQVMNSLDHQGENKNFFQYDFQNVIEDPKDFMLKIIAKVFRKAVKSLNKDAVETVLPVNHVASVTAFGETVADESVKTPLTLVFRPTEEAQMESESEDDLRVRLRGIEPGTVLYTVLGRDQIAREGDATEIGKLVLDSKLVPCQYGDEVLFFNHNI